MAEEGTFDRLKRSRAARRRTQRFKEDTLSVMVYDRLSYHVIGNTTHPYQAATNLLWCAANKSSQKEADMSTKQRNGHRNGRIAGHWRRRGAGAPRSRLQRGSQFA